MRIYPEGSTDVAARLDQNLNMIISRDDYFPSAQSEPAPAPKLSLNVLPFGQPSQPGKSPTDNL